MTANIQTIWAAYSDSWQDISPEERGRLLTASVADDVTFTAPGMSGHGISALTNMLEEFQRTRPGAYFDTTDLIAHNNQSLATWSMRDRADQEIMGGNSYARYGDDGRIVNLAGFWQT